MTRYKTRPGVEGNGRLTAFVAVLLLLTLFLVGLTVPIAQQNTRLHVLLGTIVIPVVFVKSASATWRMIRYYMGAADYRRKGPPFIILRLLGPVLVILTFILLFSGVGLIVWAPHAWYPQLSLIHKASFVLWFLAMVIHVLGHLQETAQHGFLDLVGRTRRQVAGASARLWVSMTSLAAGGVGATLLLPYVHNGFYGGN
jgi:hypothetical protein